MSDGHGKKHEKKDDEKHDEKKSDTATKVKDRFKPEGLVWWQSVLWDLVILNGLPFVWRLLRSIITHKKNEERAKPGYFVSFGEAMTKLHRIDENAYDKINDFMAVRLRKTVDREDFQVRSARMGGADVDVTVAFLRLVAAQPDHDARYNFLEMYGYIGERAMDMTERALGWVGEAFNFLKKLEVSEDFLTTVDQDTEHQREILAELEGRLGGTGTTANNTSNRRRFADWWRQRRTRRQQLWRDRWERLQQWRRERHEYKLRRLREKEETRRVEAAQPKRRRFFTMFHYRSR